jgi:hypothetical protein
VTPVKPVPVIVKVVAPSVNPWFGEMLVTVSAVEEESSWQPVDAMARSVSTHPRMATPDIFRVLIIVIFSFEIESLYAFLFREVILSRK